MDEGLHGAIQRVTAFRTEALAYRAMKFTRYHRFAADTWHVGLCGCVVLAAASIFFGAGRLAWELSVQFLLSLPFGTLFAVGVTADHRRRERTVQIRESAERRVLAPGTAIYVITAAQFFELEAMWGRRPDTVESDQL